jgi:penicillin amidase
VRSQGRIWRALLVMVVVLGLLAGGVGYFARVYLPRSVAPRSFPQVRGELQAPGLQASVDVYRDTWGIAHIYASNVHDLFFAEGYVHAQERFWQMDTWRHIGSGRLSEMFGKGTLDTDAFLRTLGWREEAESDLAKLSPDSRAMLEAYANGVNAYLKGKQPGQISLEYSVLELLTPSYKIASWEPVNSLTWAKAMAWDLRGNLDEEIERAVLLKSLGPEKVDELFPPYPTDHPSIVKTASPSSGVTPQSVPLVDVPDDALTSLQHNASLLDNVLGPTGSGIGSNSWVVAGSRTVTGTPLFANDPHLGAQMPSIWYQIDLHCVPKTDACPYSVAGFSFAGVPGVIIGHNDDIAWGMTNLTADTMDLFIERVNPDNPNQYEDRGKWVDFEKHTETIQVAGGRPVDLEVLSTRHGPVISNVYGPLKNENDQNEKDFIPFRDRSGVALPDNYVIALAWPALTQESPFDAVWAINRATDWSEFREAASHFEIAPQNLLYADVQGNIGYQMPGDIPIRASGDGRYPVPGWTGQYDWTGFIPFDEHPYAFNPNEGYIVTANNQVVPPNYPYLISTDWNYGFRARRIVDMIQSAPGKVHEAYFRTMQNDTMDPVASVIAPLALNAVEASGQVQDSISSEALQALSAWNYRAEADSVGAAIYEAFWNHLLQSTFDDDLPKDYWPKGGDRWMEVMRRIAGDPTSSWWDDQTTPGVVETRDDIMTRSFKDAMQELRGVLGNNLAGWSWGRLHTITFENQTLGTSGVGLIEQLFNRGPFPVGGGASIVDATSWTAGESYTVDWLPSMRMIVDMGKLDAAITVHTTGQSGHAYAPHYIDLAPLWSTGKYYPMLWEQGAVLDDSLQHLVLKP